MEAWVKRKNQNCFRKVTLIQVLFEPTIKYCLILFLLLLPIYRYIFFFFQFLEENSSTPFCAGQTEYIVWNRGISEHDILREDILKLPYIQKGIVSMVNLQTNIDSLWYLGEAGGKDLSFFK